MIRFFKPTLILTGFFFVFGCSSADCTKTITVPEVVIQTPTGTSYNPAYNMEVPCDYKIPEIKENTTDLPNFTYEVLSFKYTSDTGNNTSRLQYEIKLNNNNNYKVTGAPIITMDIDGAVSSGNFTKDSASPCFGLEANSSCIVTFDKEQSLNLGVIKSIKIVSVKYVTF
jgi:hypothetical protein